MTSIDRDAADGAGAGADLGTRLAAEIASLDSELAEIDMLVNQARTEAGRHEQKRAQTAEKLSTGTNLSTDDVIALNVQLVTLTRRASVMRHRSRSSRASARPSAGFATSSPTWRRSMAASSSSPAETCRD